MTATVLLEKMRLNIRQLLAVPLALAVGWGVAGKIIGKSLLIPQTAFEAYAGVRNIGDWIQELHRDGPKYDAETLSRCVGGRLLSGDPDDLRSGRSFRRDPWGNSYRVIELPDFPPLGIYSCGRDGVSSSNGFDDDDVQSWLNASSATEFYQREAARAHGTKRFKAAVVVAAILCFPLFVFLRTRRASTTEPDDARLT